MSPRRTIVWLLLSLTALSVVFDTAHARKEEPPGYRFYAFSIGSLSAPNRLEFWWDSSCTTCGPVFRDTVFKYMENRVFREPDAYLVTVIQIPSSNEDIDENVLPAVCLSKQEYLYAASVFLAHLATAQNALPKMSDVISELGYKRNKACEQDAKFRASLQETVALGTWDKGSGWKAGSPSIFFNGRALGSALSYGNLESLLAVQKDAPRAAPSLTPSQPPSSLPPIPPAPTPPPQ